MASNHFIVEPEVVHDEPRPYQLSLKLGSLIRDNNLEAFKNFIEKTDICSTYLEIFHLNVTYAGI